MVNKVKNNSTQKFHFYSGHDWSIFTIMKSLLVHKDHFPPYGASILFELREKTNKYFVTVSTLLLLIENFFLFYFVFVITEISFL